MLDIVEVRSRSQLKKFVDYPNELYKDCPYFVPAVFSDDVDDWNPKKNAAFEYCEAKCWLATRDDQIVGRIGAILSHRANEKWKTKRMRFTQVDFIDDLEVSKALFETVENWAREKGCNEVQGPLGFTDLDREGMLVEGFDKRSLFYTYYNYPYYITHMEALGYVKDVDWVENRMCLSNVDSYKEVIDKLSDRLMKTYNLHFADIKHQRDFKTVIPSLFQLVNLCYSQLYGTVELSDRQIFKYTDKYLPLLNPKLSVFIMDENDRMVAFGCGIPDLSGAMQKSHGRYLPFGWIRMLHALRKNDTIDLLLVAVIPEYQSKGVSAILLSKGLEGCRSIGIEYAETGPTLELNTKVLSMWKGIEREQHKRRRCFIKSL